MRSVEEANLARMENTPLELRPTGQHYPLTLDQRLRQGDNYRLDHGALQGTLASINRFYLSSYASAHTGDHLDCERCIGRKRQVKQAYRDWYLSDEPDRWYSKLFDYKTELASMFDSPEQYGLKEIHQRAEVELRAHLKKDLCTHVPGDTEEISDFKKSIARQLEETKPVAMILEDGPKEEIPVREILEQYLEKQFTLCPKSELVDFVRQLNASTTDEERIPIYIKYYCTSLWTDTISIKNFKAKYTRMFEQGIPHDTVVAAMRKEISSAQEAEIADLDRRLNELNLAQSAHLKAKAKKAEKDQMKDQRNLNKDAEKEKKAVCGLKDCSKELDLAADGGIQCALCDWIVGLVPEDHAPVYYCSAAHAELDHENHLQTTHSCHAISTNSCANEPVPGPPESFEASGLCRDCMEKSRKSFFCSQGCYGKNLEAHRSEHHPMGEEGEIGGQDELELFKLKGDAEVVEAEGEGDVEMKGV